MMCNEYLITAKVKPVHAVHVFRITNRPDINSDL